MTDPAQLPRHIAFPDGKGNTVRLVRPEWPSSITWGRCLKWGMCAYPAVIALQFGLVGLGMRPSQIPLTWNGYSEVAIWTLAAGTFVALTLLVAGLVYGTVWLWWRAKLKPYAATATHVFAMTELNRQLREQRNQAEDEHRHKEHENLRSRYQHQADMDTHEKAVRARNQKRQELENLVKVAFADFCVREDFDGTGDRIALAMKFRPTLQSFGPEAGLLRQTQDPKVREIIGDGTFLPPMVPELAPPTYTPPYPHLGPLPSEDERILKTSSYAYPS